MKNVALVMALMVLAFAVSGETALKDDKAFMAGLKYYNSKNYQEAIRQFKDYTAKKPDPAAYYLIGYSLYKLDRFSEADAYFKEAFFIDPEFSLEKAGLIRKMPDDSLVVGSAAPALRSEGSEVRAPEPSLREAPPARADAAPGEQAQKEQGPATPLTATQKTPEPVQQAVPAPQPPQPAPAKPAPVFPKVQPGLPPAVPATGIVAGLLGGVILFAIIFGIAFYLFFAFCLYKIAQKLDVPYPWLAFIPLASLWTLVASAGKPAWWVLLFLVPFVNAFVGIYLWVCITENLGKNKWLGLLILVPLVNIIYPAWLAFSKTEVSGDFSAGESLPE